MSRSQDTGNQGEEEVVRLVPCPNCKKKLTKLPKNYPLYDIQCTGCSFRAQVKSIQKGPSDTVLGAGWDVIEKVTKSGFLIPSLFVNYKWNIHHEIRFYPFITKQNIQKRTLSATAKRANYKMFTYVGLSELPCFVVYKK